MNAKTERFEMRLDETTLERLDVWRAKQDDLPSRAEAVRRLIEAGTKESTRGIEISDGEKLIILMLGDLYKHHKAKGDIDPKFVASAIYGGHLWGLGWRMHGLFHGYQPETDHVREVVDVLDMWSFIEEGYSRLNDDDKERVAVEAEPFGANVLFHGFSGNEESDHRSIALFMILDLDRFTIFKSRELNSHVPKMDAYRRMLSVFNTIRPTLTGGSLSATQMVRLLKEQVHPGNR